MIKKQCLIFALSLTAVVGSFTACGNASSANNAPSESITKLSEKKCEVVAAVNSEPSAGWNPVTMK